MESTISNDIHHWKEGTQKQFDSGGKIQIFKMSVLDFFFQMAQRNWTLFFIFFIVALSPCDEQNVLMFQERC